MVNKCLQTPTLGFRGKHRARPEKRDRTPPVAAKDPTASTMRVMAEAVEARARVYISAHENRSWENRDKLRRRHAAQLQDQSSGNWLAPRTGPRCAGVLWASLVPTARRVQSCSCHLKACHHSRKHSRSALRGDASTMEEKRRCRAASDRPSRASSRSGRRHRFAPPEAPPAVAIGPAVALVARFMTFLHHCLNECMH